jgi:hypothetical protein
MIIKSKGKYKVVSKRTHRNLGTYDSLKKAKLRLKQIEYYKNLNK